MMRYILLLILVCKCSLSSGKDYRYYYRQTQYAEECLLNGDLGKAIRHYDSAFAGYEFKFARDCYIAAQIAAYNNDHALTYIYLCYCLKAGLRPECMLNRRIFGPFKASQYYTQLMQQQPELRVQYLKSIDLKLNKEAARRYMEEQDAKNGPDNAYYEIVDNNIKWIQALLKKGIYPGERTIGIGNTVAMAIRTGEDSCCFSADRATPSMQHYPYSFDLMREDLLKAMYAGQIGPKELAYIFLFNKARVCRYRPGYRPDHIDSLIENTRYRDVLFNAAFEKQRTDSASANKNRYEWFIPRKGTKYNSDSLLEKYGISIFLGDII